MTNFKDFLIEAGRTPAAVNWKKKNNELFGHFSINDQNFTIEVTRFSDSEYKIYQFKFYRNDETKMFNDMQYVMGVVPTIKESLNYVIENLDLDGLIFAASDELSTRKKMYKLQAATIASKFKFHDMTKDSLLRDSGFDTDVVFGVFKTREILESLLKDY